MRLKFFAIVDQSYENFKKCKHFSIKNYEIKKIKVKNIYIQFNFLLHYN